MEFPGGRTPQQAQEAADYAAAQNMVRTGDREGVRKLLASGAISMRDLTNMIEHAPEPRGLAERLRSRSANIGASELLRAWQLMTPEEKNQYRDVMAEQLSHKDLSRLMPPQQEQPQQEGETNAPQ